MEKTEPQLTDPLINVEVQKMAASATSSQPDSSIDADSVTPVLPDSIQANTAVAAPVALSPTQSPTSNLLQIISFNAAKRNNIHMLDEETLVLSVGCVVLLVHMSSMQQRYIPGLDGGGVAAVSVHPNRQNFLVAERCSSRPPNIYIYQYPSLQLVQTLQDGTGHAYSCAVFSSDGSMLASVGSAPDYLLTLWEWRTGATLLRCKAFSQEVYSVRFSPYFTGNLVTCGTGHIRFWKMATTFTGLKLQGDIGKFGGMELSDIAAFVELPDGKVLSGSESGALLVWEGGLIKSVISRPGNVPCHNGPVEILLHETQTNYVLSGGGDGVLRLWDLSKLIDAEPVDSSNHCEVKPAVEVPLPGAGCPRGVLWEKRSWIVQSSAGALLRVSLPINLLDAKGYVANKLLDLHSGAVLGAFTCPDRHVIITAAENGTVRALDYKANRVLQSRQFSSQASCMAMIPAAVDKLQRSAVVGFADGSVRLVRRCSDGWRLVAAAKPHKAPVNSIAVNGNGTRLAVLSGAGDAFFFSMTASSLIPQFTCQLPASDATCCCWAPHSNSLLVGFANGTVAELTLPSPNCLDTSRTYEQVVSSRVYTVRSPCKKLQQLQSQQHVPLRILADRGADAMSDTGVNQQEHGSSMAAAALSQPLVTEQQDSPDDPVAEQAMLPITWLSYAADDGSRFCVWVGGQAAGQVLECSWDQALPISTSTASAGAAVTAVSSSWSGCYKMVGSADGVVRLQSSLSAAGQLNTRQWQCPLHGMQDAHVSAVAMAYDDSCIISAGSDGSIFLLSNPFGPSDTAMPVVEADWQLPSMADDAAATGGQPDNADLPPDGPSLEEAKQAAQLNQQAAAAAAAREQLIAAIQAMSQEHAVLVAENDARQHGQRVPTHMLEIDAGLEDLVERERSERLADARAQVAYEAELAQLRLSKLQQYFIASLTVHHLTLHSISGKNTVSTFRQADLPKEVQLSIAEAEREESTQQRLQPELTGQPSKGCQGAQQSSTHQPGFSGGAEGSSPGLPGPNASSVLSRAELWRQTKKARAAEWATFNASRPDEKYEAPTDIAALVEAAATIGDYKLKSEPGYVLPEEERMTPAKKRRQMLFLMQDMNSAQASFNSTVLKLREEKRSLLKQLNAKQAHVAIINTLLGITDPLPDMVMLPSEEPEQQLTVVTDAQVAAHQAAKKVAADKAATAGTGGGFGGFASASNKPNSGGKAEASKKTPANAIAGQKQQATESCRHNKVSSEHGAANSAAAGMSHAELRKLTVERQQLLDQMSALCSAFDAALGTARSAQIELAVGLKAAEQQLLLMVRELGVLKEAEVQELVLEAKRSAKAAEQAELAGRLAEVNNNLDAKKAEGDAAAARRAAVAAELEMLLADQDAFKEQLTKVFFRRIKRNRHHCSGDNDDGDGSSCDDSMSDDESSSGSDNDDGEEVCPPGCDPSLYERVVDMRERRLDEEDATAEVAKALESIKKERELLSKKAKLLDQSLAAINQSVLEFQQDKQARLNQLPAVVSLRLHQVEFIEGKSMHDSLTEALMFSQPQLERLKQRMHELDEERIALKQQQKELRRQHSQLQTDKSDKETHLTELSNKCSDVQMLKFGQVIDVALLDTIGVRNKGADELREQLKRQAHASTSELDEWDAKIVAMKRELLVLSRDNTTALNTVTQLTRTQRELEAAVMAGRSALWTDPLDSRRTAVAERDKLVATINQQAGELDSLRNKIRTLRRKDSSLYS